MSSAMGAYLANAVMTVVLTVAVGIGALMAGSDAATPMEGGARPSASTQRRFAIAGPFRTSTAAETMALLVTVTFLIDLMAPAPKP